MLKVMEIKRLETDREKPYWINGCKDNPDGVILALYGVVPEAFKKEYDCELKDILFNNHSGFRDNAANDECIFYYDEYFRNHGEIRLFDECCSLSRELIATSSAWIELKPIPKNVVELIRKSVLVS